MLTVATLAGLTFPFGQLCVMEMTMPMEQICVVLKTGRLATLVNELEPQGRPGPAMPPPGQKAAPMLLQAWPAKTTPERSKSRPPTLPPTALEPAP